MADGDLATTRLASLTVGLRLEARQFFQEMARAETFIKKLEGSLGGSGAMSTRSVNAASKAMTGLSVSITGLGAAAQGAASQLAAFNHQYATLITLRGGRMPQTIQMPGIQPGPVLPGRTAQAGTLAASRGAIRGGASGTAGFLAIGTVGLMAGQAAPMDRNLATTSIITGRSPQTLRAEAVAMSRAMRIPLSDAIAAQRAVAEIGNLGPGGDSAALTRAALQIGATTKESADLTARDIVRLGTATRTPLTAANIGGIGSAFIGVSQRAAADPGEVQRMVRDLQSAGLVSNLSAPDLLALSAAIASQNPNARESTRGTLIRIFGAEGEGRVAQQARLLGLSEAETRRIRQNDPMRFLELSAARLAAGGVSGQDIADVFGPGIRTQATLALLTSQSSQLFAPGGLLDVARGEFGAGGGFLERTYAKLSRDLQGTLGNLKSGFEELALTVAQSLQPAFEALAALVRGIAETAKQHPGLVKAGGAAALGLGAIAIGGFVGRGLGPAMGGFRAIPGMLAGVGGAFAGGAGGATAALGRGIVGVGAGAGLATATGVGAIIAAIMVVGPILGQLSGWLQEVSEKSKSFGNILKLLALTFEIIAGAATLLNKLFGGLFKLIEGFFNLPIISDIVGAVGGALDTATNKVRDLRTGNTVNVNIGGGDNGVSQANVKSAMNNMTWNVV